MSHAIVKTDLVDIPVTQQQSTHQAHIKPADGFELKPTRLAVHKLGKPVFGRIVPFYRLCVETVDDDKEILQSVDIPTARFDEALTVMRLAFHSDEKKADEDFALWGARKGYPFFTEILEEILPIGPDDLPHLLDAHVKTDSLEEVGLHFV